MKNKFFKLLPLILCLSLLCGCSGIDGFSGADIFPQDGDRDDIPSFKQMEYLRPDVDELEAAVEEVEAALAEGAGIRRISEGIDLCYELYYNFDTMYTICDIRNSQNLDDSFYAEEYLWCGSMYPVAQQLMDRLFYSCAASDMAPRLEEDIFWEGFADEYSPVSSSPLSDEAVELMSREAELLSQYRELSSSPSIRLPDGSEVDFGFYISDPFLSSAEYDRALDAYYDKYNQGFADIYIELVNTRNTLARALGYSDYEHMQYEYEFERDYSPEEARRYLQDIKEIMVPFYKELSASDSYWLEDPGYISESRLLHILSSGTRNMGGCADEAYRYMLRHGLYDVSQSNSKAAMSFETYLSDYEAPFLFVDSMGSAQDILTFSHEFGHFLDAYVNYNAYETIDLSETFSQAMEYLMLYYYGGALSEEDRDNLFRLKMLDTADMYVQQASFAEFESRVYSAAPGELDADFLNELSLELAIDYGYFDGRSYNYYAKSWSDVVHYFEMPFYIITYPVSNDAAMQIYELERDEPGRGLSKYMEMLPREYPGIIESANSAGLESPFAPGRIQKVCNDLRELLDVPALAA